MTTAERAEVYDLAAMNQSVGVFVVVVMALGACSSGTSGQPAESSVPGASVVPDRTDPTAGSEPGSDLAGLSIDVSDLAPTADEAAAVRLQEQLQEDFIAELAVNGVVLDIADLRSFTNDALDRIERDIRAEFVTDETADAVEESATGGLAANPNEGPRPIGFRNPATTPTIPNDDQQGGNNAVMLILGVIVNGLSFQHTGPGDFGPRTTNLGANVITVTKAGTKVTITFKAVADDLTSSPRKRLELEFRSTIDVCPDEAGEIGIEFDTRVAYSADIPGKGTASGEFQLAGSGTAAVGDDAKVNATSIDFKAARARRTTADGKVQPGASFLELQVTGADMIGNTVGSAEVPRASTGATEADVAKMLTDVGDAMTWFVGFLLVKTNDGWMKGECIQLEIDMPKSVGPGSQTPAEATVEHRYEDRVLELPIAAQLKAGEVSIEPAEATGDPAMFTYRAPSEANKVATIDFTVTSKRGADLESVDVQTTPGSVEVAFSGTIAYSVQGFAISGAVTIPPIILIEYSGDDPELAGKWVGDGAIEVALTSDIPGCGTATGSQSGGRVTIVATPSGQGGKTVLSLFSEEMEGGQASMSCGAAGAILEGGGISIGAGLINLGDVVIPTEPGTYPFEASGLAAGLVDYEVKGEAVVTEPAGFPG